jgi:aspartate racemase
MRYLGLLGGMSWESTVEYYKLLNRAVSKKLGGLHSAPLLMHSVDFSGFAAKMESGDWDGIGARLAEAARGLEQAGAEGFMLCSNTMHHVADRIQAATTIPMLHIIDPTGEAMRKAGIKRAGLLGTGYTMRMSYWPERLKARFGIEMDVPNEADRALVHRVIFEELCLGKVLPASREAYLKVIDRLLKAGAQGIVFGCTEIAMLIDPASVSFPAFDTAALHAEAGAQFIMEDVHAHAW